MINAEKANKGEIIALLPEVLTQRQNTVSFSTPMYL